MEPMAGVVERFRMAVARAFEAGEPPCERHVAGGPRRPETCGRELPQGLALLWNSGHMQPEKRLMLAVLADAMVEFVQASRAAGWRSRRMAAEIEAWFSTDEAEWPFSFTNICDSLGLDVQRLRAALRQCRAEALRALAAETATELRRWLA